MKKILSYVAYQRKLNISVDLKNRGTQLDIYDFIDVSNNLPSYTSYINKGGNCYLCAICDYMNLSVNEGVAKYIPMPKTCLNVNLYKRVCYFYKYQARNSLKCNNVYSLIDVVNKNVNCIMCVAYNGGYHEIAFVNGLFYNNWDVRKGLTLEELKKDFGYTRTPKLIFVEYDVISKLNKCIEYGLIKKC